MDGGKQLRMILALAAHLLVLVGESLAAQLKYPGIR